MFYFLWLGLEFGDLALYSGPFIDCNWKIPREISSESYAIHGNRKYFFNAGEKSIYRSFFEILTENEKKSKFFSQNSLNELLLNFIHLVVRWGKYLEMGVTLKNDFANLVRNLIPLTPSYCSIWKLLSLFEILYQIWFSFWNCQ